MITPLTTFSPKSSTISKYLNSSSYTNTHHLHIHHQKTIKAYTILQQYLPLPKYHIIAAAVLWVMMLKNTFFSKKNLDIIEHLRSHSMR